MEAQARNSLRVASVKQMASQPPYEGVFTESALRALIHNAEARFSSRGHQIPGNGLMEVGAILRVGRRILFDLDRFDDWLKSHRASPEVR
jgi:hypothetical protein